MRLPKNPTAFDVARKVICDAWDLKVAGDLTTLDLLLEVADQTVGCGYHPRKPDAWKRPGLGMSFGPETRRWWMRYLKAKDVMDCMVQEDIKRNQEECAHRSNQRKPKRRTKK